MEDKNDYVLPQEDRIRYSRQILLDEIGEEGQRRLFHYRVLIIGAGGLGSPADDTSLYPTSPDES